MAVNIIDQVEKMHACVKALQSLSALAINADELIGESFYFIANELEECFSSFNHSFDKERLSILESDISSNSSP